MRMVPDFSVEAFPTLLVGAALEGCDAVAGPVAVATSTAWVSKWSNPFIASMVDISPVLPLVW
jgi:hypothetical protein